MKLTLRLDDTLKLRLQEAAKESGRSLNSEIIHRLNASLQGWKR